MTIRDLRPMGTPGKDPVKPHILEMSASVIRKVKVWTGDKKVSGLKEALEYSPKAITRPPESVLAMNRFLHMEVLLRNRTYSWS